MKALVLGPHTDDVELGCGGTLQKYDEIHYVAFSSCNNQVLADECRRATFMLKIKTVEILDFKVRRFSESRQQILDHIRTYRQGFFDSVFFPERDTHQDHAVIHDEAIRAFKGLTCDLLAYELPWNSWEQRFTTFSPISEDQLKLKVAAITRYKSQEHRPYMTPDFVRSLATVRGVQAGTKYAEAFRAIRTYL